MKVLSNRTDNRIRLHTLLLALVLGAVTAACSSDAPAQSKDEARIELNDELTAASEGEANRTVSIDGCTLLVTFEYNRSCATALSDLETVENSTSIALSEFDSNVSLRPSSLTPRSSYLELIPLEHFQSALAQAHNEQDSLITLYPDSTVERLVMLSKQQDEFLSRHGMLSRSHLKTCASARLPFAPDMHELRVKVPERMGERLERRLSSYMERFCRAN
jgi:hypothetical protein